MKARQFATSVYTALKATTRAFVEASFGTQQLAAAATRVEQPDISDYGNTLSPAKADRFMPIDVLLDLVKASGDTRLLKFMAQQADCLLVPLPRAIGSSAVTERSGRSAHEFGEVMAGVFGALANDGRITPDEAGPILNDIRELMLELAGLAEAVKAATAVETIDG